MQKSTRQSYFDFLRILAIFCVIYNHTGKHGVLVYAYTQSSMEKFFGYLLSIITSELPVPLFFMISGALLLGRNESLKELFSKRIFKMTLILVVFSIAMYLYKSGTGTYHYSLSEFFSTFFSAQILPSYWYLYAYLAYLLCLPLLRILVSGMKPVHYIYLFLLYLILGTLPNVISLWIKGFSLNGSFSIPFLENIIFYPLMGYYFGTLLSFQDLKEKYRTPLAISGMIGLCLTYLFTKIYALPPEEFTSFNKGIFQSSLMSLFVIFIFVLFRCKKTNSTLSEKRALLLWKASSLVFGVYLIETPIRESLTPVFTSFHPYIGVIPSTFCLVAATLLVSAIPVALFKLFWNTFRPKAPSTTKSGK